MKKKDLSQITGKHSGLNEKDRIDTGFSEIFRFRWHLPLFKLINFPLLTFIILLILGNSKLLSQEKFRFHHISIEDGLSNSNVSCIMQDSTGFIWIGTEDGLNSFNGTTITNHFHIPSNPHSIRNNQINSLCLDIGDNFWVAHKRGIDYYISDKDIFMPAPMVADELQGEIMSTILHKALDGSIYAGTSNGIFKFNPGTGSFEKYNLNIPGFNNLNDEEITYIATDRHGTFWIGTLDYGVFYREAGSNNFQSLSHIIEGKNSLHGNKIFCIYEDNQNIIWIASEQGLYEYSIHNGSIRRYLSNPEIRNSLPHRTISHVIEDSQNRLWILTNGGLSLFNRKSKSFITYKNNDYDPFSLSNNPVRYLFEDFQNNLWIGGVEDGINILKSQSIEFENFTRIPNHENSLNYAYVLSVLEDKEGKIWIGTNGGGINIYHPKENKYTYILPKPDNPDGIQADAIQALMEDHDGNIWIGTYLGGLTKFNPKTGKFKTYLHDPENPRSISNNIINHIYQDSEKNIWISTNGGLNRYIPSSDSFVALKTSEPNSAYSLSNIFCTVVSEDADGYLWVGTYFGLNKIDPDSRQIQKYFQSDNPGSLSDNVVYTILEDNQKRIWIGTSMGLNLYDKENDTFKQFTLQHGLPNNSINGILEDSRGNLWISTNNGLSRYDNNTGTFSNFDFNDGLITTEFHHGTYYKNDKGKFYFGGKRGLSAFYPDKYKVHKIQIPLILTDFYINNKLVRVGEKDSPLKQPISKTSEIVLAHNQSFIAFNFTALNYINPEKDKYSYILSGFDNNWINIGNNSTANYTNIPPGTYTFQTKVTHNNNYVTTSKPITIIVKPPIWKTVYAYIVYFLIILSAIYLIWNYIQAKAMYKHSLLLERIEKEKVVELNQAKLRFFINVSHEFKTPLTLIISPIEKLLRSQSMIENKEILTKTLKTIYKNAARLSRLITQIIDLRKIDTGNVSLSVSNFNMVDFVKDISNSFDDYAHNHAITFEIISQYDKLTAWFDPDKMEKVIFNILSNAFHYTRDGGIVRVYLEKSVNHKVRTEKNENMPNQTFFNGIQKKFFPKNNAGNNADVKIEQPFDEYVKIKIEDNGKGIEPDKIKKIFTRFYQGDNDHLANPTSSGIGLSLAKEFIEFHKGFITVESQFGKGSAFTIYIPTGNEHFKSEEIKGEGNSSHEFVELHPEMDEEYKATNKPAIADHASKYRILVAEDNHELRNFILDNLEPIYEVYEAANGMEALKLAGNIFPHLIISDIMMPELSGVELCKRIKSDIITCHIPIILLTVLSDIEHQIEGFETGADDYITKPFNISLLEVKIRAILENRKKIIQRFVSNPKIETHELSENNLDKKFLNQVIALVEKNLDNTEFSVDDFCKSIGMSRSHLHVKLKALTNQSATEFIRIIRLKKAAEFLQKDEFNIAEIAYNVGFNHISYFNRCFRKYFGKTPSDYQKDLLAP